MATEPEEHPNAKYNKKRHVWTFIKNSALLTILLLFLLSTILILDAYKFISIRHAKFARKKLMNSLYYMDPTLIESHSGFKVLTVEEYEKLSTQVSDVRRNIREANSELQEKYAEVLKVAVEVQGLKKDIEDVKKMEEEVKKEGEGST